MSRMALHALQLLLDRWHFQTCAPFGPNLLLAERDYTLERLLLKILNVISKRWQKTIYFRSSKLGTVWKKPSVRKFLPSYSAHKIIRTWKLVLFQACEQSFAGLQEETERMQLNSVPGFAETASTTRSTATHLFTFVRLGFRCC